MRNVYNVYIYMYIYLYLYIYMYTYINIYIYIYIIWTPLVLFFQFSGSSVCVFHFVTQQIKIFRNSTFCHMRGSFLAKRRFTEPHYSPASNRNEYHEYFLGVKAAGA